LRHNLKGGNGRLLLRHIGRVEGLLGCHLHSLEIALVGDEKLLSVEPDPGAIIPNDLSGLLEKRQPLGWVLFESSRFNGLVEFRAVVKAAPRPLGGLLTL